MISKIFQEVKNKAPLVHNITNYVTARYCADVLYSFGARAIMADEPDEMKDIVKACDSLCMNIGTLNKRTSLSMILASKYANKYNKPVVFDPVGVGASRYRHLNTVRILEKANISCICGNYSEIKMILNGYGATDGVDSVSGDYVEEHNLDEAIKVANSLALYRNCVVAITGPIDLVSDGKTCYCIYNGHAKMGAICGTGCQLSSFIGAFIGAYPENILNAVVSAVVTMDIAGELAAEDLCVDDGYSTYKDAIINALSFITKVDIKERENYEIR